LKQDKPCFDEECSKLINQRLQDPGRTNGDYPNSLRHETRRIFGNNKREYRKEKVNELEQAEKQKYQRHM